MTNEVDFQTAAPATPPVGTKIATRDRAGVSEQVIEVDVGGAGGYSPLVAGQAANADSIPVTLSTDQEAELGGLTETAPATDTASSGLNGRLQRIAQRLTSIIALLPTSLGSGGGLKVDGSGTALPVSGSVTANAGTNLNTSALALDTSVGGLTETAPATDTASSGLNGRLQRIAQRLTSIIALLPTALGSGGGLKIDGSGTALPVVDTLTEAGVGGVADSQATNGTSSWSVIALLKGLYTNLAANRVTTPSWTSGTAVIAIQMLAKGAVPLRGTLSLVGKRGGYLTIFIMRSGTTALDVAIDVNVRRLVQTSPQIHSAPVFSASSEKIAAVQGVAAASGNGAGVTSLTLNAAKTFVANSTGYIEIGVIDNTTTPTLASEILRQVLATSTTVKLLEYPTESAHNSTAHVVADQCNRWTVWVEGGETFEVNINYGTATTGDSVCVGAYFSSYDADGSI